jgi:hypothetical protein
VGFFIRQERICEGDHGAEYQKRNGYSEKHFFGLLFVFLEAFERQATAISCITLDCNAFPPVRQLPPRLFDCQKAALA